MSPRKNLEAFMGPLSLDEKYFCIYIRVSCFSSVKSELNWSYFFCRLNWCNLSLLAEDDNGSDRQGFRSRQTKAILLKLITDLR